MLLLFFLTWVVFNGRLNLEIALFGIAVAGAVFAFVCQFMDYSLEKELRFYKRMPAFAQYVYYLLKEIVAANLAVTRMILANSITLTPGTITVSLTEDNLLVHCLDKSLAEGMEDSVFVRLLQKMEEI